MTYGDNRSTCGNEISFIVVVGHDFVGNTKGYDRYPSEALEQDCTDVMKRAIIVVIGEPAGANNRVQFGEGFRLDIRVNHHGAEEGGQHAEHLQNQ